MGNTHNGQLITQADARRLAIRRHTPEELEAMIIKARYDYGQDPPPSRLASAVLMVWASVCDLFYALVDAQDWLLGGDGVDR